MDSLVHQVHCSEAVVEPRMNGPRIYHIAHSELLDAAQALHIRMLENIVEQIALDTDKSKHGVVDYFLLTGHVVRAGSALLSIYIRAQKYYFFLT